MAQKDFTNGFLECAMWLGKRYESEEAAERGEGDDLLDVFEPSDIPADIMREIESDCTSFYEAHAALWQDEPYYDDEQAGHDFFLTRNGHGAGFWDRGIENGDELTAASKPYGSFNLEAFADGPVYAHH